MKGKQHKASCRTKDETSSILRKFITEIENLKDLKVKIIRCDNEGEFRNKELNDFFHKRRSKESLAMLGLLSRMGHEEHLESTSSQPQGTCNTDVSESSGNSNLTATSTNPPDDQLETLTVETPIPTTSSPVPTVSFSDSQEPSSATRLISKRVTNQEEIPSLDNILTLTN
nr:hypothetical protein [Tanacetum cinerariifolium]